MTSFRRFVIGIAEAVQILSMIVCTLWGGAFGAASGALRSSMFGMLGNVQVDGLGTVASTGAVLGFILGALSGFVISSTLAGVVFTFAQIERNTRSLLDSEVSGLVQPEHYSGGLRQGYPRVS